jgi:NADH-quinone oxidoreductase subunit J
MTEVPTMSYFLLVGLLILVAVLALLSVEARDLLHAVLYLAGAAVALAMIYLLLFAPWVAFFQLAIYGGAVTILLVAAIALTTRRETGEPEEAEVT